MDQHRIEIALKRSADDPEINDPQFQLELAEVSKSLRKANVTFSQRAMAFDAVDAVGYPLPEFFVTLGPVVTAAAAIFGAWVQARYGRKVRLKVGDVEAEGRTVEEIELLLKRAAEFRQSKPTESDKT